ncbi:DUF6958 family protein [Brevundimonas lenta]|uniref:Uncharacterized protein n=1 Tax=Brevundimonas lenta TaxID=424796 RepID=A0A7W6JD75_9CAUL|nr:hypothetical protein [Brevundimonas lenta]MBB4082973.1 hypothetical protein [Brevundimonas lenta]
MPPRTILVENAVSGGKPTAVNADKYEAMRDAYLKAVPSGDPGATPAEILTAVKPALPDDLFPGGATAGWWAKCVQLDLEAKGVIVRGPKSPVRLRKT